MAMSREKEEYAIMNILMFYLYINIITISFRVIHLEEDGLSSRFIMEHCSVLNEINCPVKNGYWLFCLFYVTQLCTSILLSSWGYLGHFILQRVYRSFENRFYC